MNKGYTNANPAADSRDDLQGLFAEGKLAMLIASDRLPAFVADKGAGIDAQAAPIPAGEEGTPFSVCSSDHVVVFRNETAPGQAARSEAVARFLTYLYAPENYAGWALAEGFLPAARSAALFCADKDASCGAWPELLENGRCLPSGLPGWNAVCEGLYSTMQLSLIGGDVQAALDSLQASVASGS